MLDLQRWQSVRYRQPPAHGTNEAMRGVVVLLLLAGCNTVREDLPGHMAIRAEALGYAFNVFPYDPEFQVVRVNFGLPRRDTYPAAVLVPASGLGAVPCVSNWTLKLSHKTESP